MAEPTVTVILTEADATQFKLFQQHYDIFLLLQQTGAFDIHTGKCTMNFASGILQNIVKEEMVYHRSLDTRTVNSKLK